MTSLSLKALTLGLVFALAACAPSGTAPATPVTSTPSSAEFSAPVKKSTFPAALAIADAMSAAGLGCEEYAATGAAKGAIDRAICWIGDRDLILSIFPGPEGVLFELEEHRKVNQIIHGGVHVAGSNWTISVDRWPLAKSIADSIGGVVIDFDRIGEGPLPDLPR